MPYDVEARITRLLDQLDDPQLTEQQIDRIKKKIDLLQQMQVQQS